METTKDYVPPHEHKEYITRQDCECFMKADECNRKMNRIDLALYGEDGLNGIVTKINSINSKVDVLAENAKETKKKGRDWRLLWFAIGASLTTGTVIALLNFLLIHFH